MTVETNKDAVRAFFAAMNEGDTDAAFALLRPECTWFSLSARRFRTLTEMRAALEWVNSVAVTRPIQISVVGMTAEGDRVAAQCEGQAVTATGQRYDNLYHFLFEFDGPLIGRLWEYNDTAHVKEVFRLAEDGTLALQQE
jgi:ketosteroid isomerase-like protein